MSEQADRGDIADALANRCSKSGDNMSHLLCGELVHRQHYDEADALLNWLAQRDRRVAAKALREAANEAPLLLLNIGAGVRESYIRAVDLRERADRIEAGD